MTKPRTATDISIIVLNYNAKSYLNKCIESFIDSDYGKYNAKLIVVDNASTDDSFTEAQKYKSTNKNLTIKYLGLPKNIGFSAGNNQGVKVSDPASRYVVFINPDTIINQDTIAGMIKYLDDNPHISAATCYIKFALTGGLQPECHRGFPTPWNAFWHFFGFGLPRLFPSSRLFNGYFLGHLDYTKPQQIDCCVGAFLMLRREVGETIGWWNEKYFMYGEDLDICYQLKRHNFRLFFVPFWQITHYQGVSSGIKKVKSAATRETRVRSARATVTAMRIFYENNLIQDYPTVLRGIIMFGIRILETIRIFKARYL